MVLHTQRHMNAQYERDFKSVSAYVIMRSGKPVANVIFKIKGPKNAYSVYVEYMGDDDVIGHCIKGVRLDTMIRFAANAEPPLDPKASKTIRETEALATLCDTMNLHYRAVPSNTKKLVAYRARFSQIRRALTSASEVAKYPYTKTWIGACLTQGLNVIVVI